MTRVTDVEPMINMCQASAMYKKPFGVILHFGDTRHRYSDFNLALCGNLTQSQRTFIRDVQEQSHKAYSNYSLSILRNGENQ